MKPILAALPVFAGVIVSALSLGVNAEESKSKERKPMAVKQAVESFAGTWNIVDVQPAGATQDARQLVFRKDGTYAALDADNKELWGGTFDLDPTTTPKVWDHRSYEAEKTGGDALGIYELDGDQLKVCCVVGSWNKKQWTGKPRPTAFEFPAADVVLKLQRVQPVE